MSAEHGPLSLEKGKTQDELLIDATHLIRDNQSGDAAQRRSSWEEARVKGNLIAIYRCSDARVKPPGLESVSWGSIATGKEPSSKLASDRGIRASLVINHFDMDVFNERGLPEGCGGLGAKKEIGEEKHEHGVLGYVSEKVTFSDATMQAVWTAMRVANLSGKPVMAALQNHLDFSLYPVAFFDKGKTRGDVNTEVLEAIARKRFSPEIYKDVRLPTIDQSSLPDLFIELLERNRKEAESLNVAYSDLRKLQKTQKPRMIILSTDIRSARVRYPVIASVPGSMFRVHVSREKIEGKPKIQPEDLNDSLRELEYPISHAVENHKDPEKPFSNTDRLLIETSDIELSIELAQRLQEQKDDWMREWLKLPDRKIIAMQTKGGIVNPHAIEEFTS